MTLRELRTALGLGQKRLDQMAGLTVGTVAQIESGQNANPTIHVCRSIVAALKDAGATGASVDTLFAKPESTVTR